MNAKIVYLLLFTLITSLLVGHMAVSSTPAMGKTIDLIHKSNLIDQKHFFNDPLTTTDDPIRFSIIPFVFYAIAKLLGHNTTLILAQIGIPLALLGSIITIGERIKYDEKELLPILLMITLSPTLIYASFANTQLMAIIALQVFGIALLCKKHRVLGIIFLCLAATQGLIQLVTSIILCSIIYQKKIISKKEMIVATVSQIVISTLVITPQMILNPNLSTQAIGIGNMIIEIGADGGLSMIVISLAILGSLVLYKRKYFVYSIVMVGLIALSYWIKDFYPYAAIVIGLVAGLFIAYLEDYRWELKQLRALSFATIGIGVVFIVALASTQVILANPTKAHLETLSWINENVNNDAVIFGPQDYQLMIKAFAQKKISNDIDTKSIINEIYLPKITEELDKRQITHIYLPPESIKNKNRNDPSGGLIYLLKNNETFKKIHEDNGHIVWLYLKAKNIQNNAQ